MKLSIINYQLPLNSQLPITSEKTTAEQLPSLKIENGELLIAPEGSQM